MPVERHWQSAYCISRQQGGLGPGQGSEKGGGMQAGPAVGVPLFWNVCEEEDQRGRAVCRDRQGNQHHDPAEPEKWRVLHYIMIGSQICLEFFHWFNVFTVVSHWLFCTFGVDWLKLIGPFDWLEILLWSFLIGSKLFWSFLIGFYFGTWNFWNYFGTKCCL